MMQLGLPSGARFWIGVALKASVEASPLVPLTASLPMLFVFADSIPRALPLIPFRLISFGGK